MNILFVLAGLLILLAVEAAVYGRMWPKGMKASVRFDQSRAVEGDTVELCQVVEYTGRLPLPWVRVKFQISKDITIPDTTNSSVTDRYTREDIFFVGRMEKVTRRLPVVCDRRGQHRVFSVDAVSSDLFHVRKLVAGFGGDQGITVYPRRTNIPEITDAAHQLIGEHIVRRSRMEDPFMFRGVREYVPGDPLSSINWRATARTGELAVNQYEHTSDLCVSVWLGIEEHNDRRDHELDEESIRIAATLVGTFIDEGIPVALCSNGRDCFTEGVVRVGHGSSQEHKDTCLTALARLDIEKDAQSMTEFVRSIPRSSNDSELVIVVSSDVNDRVCEAVSAFTADRELLWIVPVRYDEESEIPMLKKIKNSCVWRVVCER